MADRVGRTVAAEMPQRQLEAEPGTDAVIIDLEATSQLDTTSADALAELIKSCVDARSTCISSG